jgi:outer membrane protein
MNKMIRTLLTLAALAVGSTALRAQPAMKLIVVDMAKVFDAHYKSEEANAKFRDAEQKAQEQAEEIRKQGQALVDEYKELDEQTKNALLTPEARTKAQADAQKKMQEIQQKQSDLQGFLQNTQRSLQQRIKTHRDLLLEEISKTVTEMAKKQGATLVLDKSGPTLFGIPAIIYADPAYDITEDVIKEVNKDRPAPVAAPAAAAPAAGAATTAPGAPLLVVPNVTPKPATPEPKK